MDKLLDLAAVFLPLLGALAAWLGGRKLGDRFAQSAACLAVFAAAICSGFVFYDVALAAAPRTHVLLPWVQMAGLTTHWAVRLDTLSVLMVALVNGVSALVHLYAVGYMAHDKSVPRFMAYLSLFTFFMLMLVTANDLLQLFFGWEGVGLASYLLIGFWFDRPRATMAAMKAFLVNRVGDFGLLLGLFGCYQLCGSLDLDRLFAALPDLTAVKWGAFGYEAPALTVVALLFLLGAMGKSAQIGLHVWLPDAMEGPTPVSALIHAATMVTAGVFLLARLSPLFEGAPVAREAMIIVGAITTVFAASIALTQFDIKRVIAYSTMSQLGYMFFAAGVSAYGAAMFHLVTHAFFKALLFLAAGCVIHAMEGEQDMRRMGGLARKLPVTYGLMWIGALALAGIGVEGVFGFAGFYSKEMILQAAFAHGGGAGYAAWGMGLVGAFMTAFYTCRLLILTFHGEEADATAPVADAHAHAHEAPWSMLAPLFVLAAGAVGAGLALHGWFSSESFWQGSLFVSAASREMLAAPVPEIVRVLPVLAALAGFGLAGWLYLKRPDMHEKLVARLGPVHRIAANKFYFDEIYDRLLIRPARKIGHLLHVKVGFFDDLYDFLFVRVIQRVGAALWQRGDEALIDRLGPDGVAALARWVGRGAARAQTGFLPHYAFVMAAGLVAFVGWALIKGY